MSDKKTMSYSDVRSAGQKLYECYGTLSDICKELGSIIDSLDSWRGAARDEFMLAYNKLVPEINDTVTVLYNYYQQLYTSVTQQQETDSTGRISVNTNLANILPKAVPINAPIGTQAISKTNSAAEIARQNLIGISF